MDLYITTPANADAMGVVVWCEHVENGSGRPVTRRQERFLFRDLHADEYTVQVRYTDREGRPGEGFTRVVFVSD